MTAAAAVRSALRSSSSLRNAASKFTSTTRSAPPPSFRLPKPLSAPQILRSPTELSFCVESLLPMHSATASALMTSMLSVSRRDFGWLSEGQDDTR